MNFFHKGLIHKYTTDWIEDFEALKDKLSSGLTGITCRIEHIGSTSVTKLDSKPIIDIDIVYEHTSLFEKIKIGLLKLGYYHNGNQGIEQREVFKRNENSSHKILDTISHHLYVCPIDSEPLERHLLMRDFLRKNDWARLQYQRMKYEIAEKADHDRKLYAALKELHVNKFIDEIIALEKAGKS